MDDELESPSESRLASALNPRSTFGSVLLPFFVIMLASGWWIDHRRLSRKAAVHAYEAQEARLSIMLLQAERANAKRPLPTVPAMPPTALPSMAKQRFEGVEFVPPAGWSSEQINGGLLLAAPKVEGNWQANVFLEVHVDQEARSLEQVLAAVAPNLAKMKPEFEEVSRLIETRSSGIRLGRIEFTSVDEGARLTEWEVLVELGGNKKLFVAASSATTHWNEYLPIFHAFLTSLRVSLADQA